MHNPLSAQLRLWGERATLGEHVIIFVRASAHGGMDGARTFARRLSVGFANIRRAERLKVDKRSAKAGERFPLWEAPFERVTCMAFRTPIGYEVHFMTQHQVENLFEEITPNASVATPSASAEPTRIDVEPEREWEVEDNAPPAQVPIEPYESTTRGEFGSWADNIDLDDPFGDGEDASANALDTSNERE